MADFMTDLLLKVVRPINDGLQAEFGIPATIEADCLMLSIKYQESGPNAVRDQGDPAVTGPATGLWQFEKGGGIWEILNHAKISPIFRNLCARVGVQPVDDTVWRFFTTPQSDELAAAAARLVLYIDPAAIPPATLAAAQAALAYYLRRWRPAKNAQREQDFLMKAWPAAVAIVTANPREAHAPALGAALASSVPTSAQLGPAAGMTPPDPSLTARVAALERRFDAVGAAFR